MIRSELGAVFYAVAGAAIIFTITGIGLLVYPGDNIPEPWQTILIALVSSMYWYLIIELIQMTVLRAKYIKIQGSYVCYGYKTDKPEDSGKTEYYQLKEGKSGSTAILKYCGGNSFKINVMAGRFIWEGDFVMQSENRAEIAWWYVSPEGMEHTIGYKKAVVRIDNKSVNIVLFGTDKSRFGRELLVKNSKVESTSKGLFLRLINEKVKI